ncbi:hypothetical protein BDZ89DRAFT_1016778, partial [Hymenopellis radicata]
MQTGRQLRRLFVIILKDGNPTNPHVLWEKFRAYICDDLEHYLRRQRLVLAPTDADVYDYGLYLIERALETFGLSLSNSAFREMPQPNIQRWTDLEGNRLIQEQRAYDVEEQERLAN